MCKRLIVIIGALLLLAGNAFAQDIGPVAATVNGAAITQAALEERMASASVLNKQTDDSLTSEEKHARDAALRRQTLDTMIQETVLLQEASRRGLNAETLREDIEQRFRKMAGAVTAYVLSTYPDLEGDALTEQVESLLASTGASLESYYQTAITASILSALDQQLVTEAAAPTRDELLAAYDELWREQRQAFASDENAYEAALLQGALIVHRPRTVKRIRKAEFHFDQGAALLIGQTEQVSPEEAADMRRDQQTRAKDRADAAYAALERGETDFTQLLDQLGQTGPDNYFHPDSTRFSQDYYSRAMALRAAGDFSTPYEITNGYALLFYAGDLPACQRVPMDEVEAALTESLSAQNREHVLAEAKAALVSAAQITLNGDTAE